MTGPEHYAEAERLLLLADRHTRSVTCEQEWTLTLTAAQVYATLALAAATAVGTAGPDGHAWADVLREWIGVEISLWSQSPRGLHVVST